MYIECLCGGGFYLLVTSIGRFLLALVVDPLDTSAEHLTPDLVPARGPDVAVGPIPTPTPDPEVALSPLAGDATTRISGHAVALHCPIESVIREIG